MVPEFPQKRPIKHDFDKQMARVNLFSLTYFEFLTMILDFLVKVKKNYMLKI